MVRKDFVGEPDNVLREVLKLLRHLSALDGGRGDVRPVLQEMFQLPQQLASMRQVLLGDEPEPGDGVPYAPPRSRL